MKDSTLASYFLDPSLTDNLLVPQVSGVEYFYIATIASCAVAL